MAKSSADDEELKRACEAAIEGTKQKIVMSIRVAKSQGVWGKTAKLGRGGHMAKPRVLAISSTLPLSLYICILIVISNSMYMVQCIVLMFSIVAATQCYLCLNAEMKDGLFLRA